MTSGTKSLVIVSNRWVVVFAKKKKKSRSKNDFQIKTSA